jgi:DNA helicase-2/ATP-dependent DNA helicase PcrA
MGTVSAALIDGLNDSQREGVEALSGPVLIVAGPGSGKTKVLTHRVAALLESGVDPWRVVAVTFTNKAAGEMRERLHTLVGEQKAKGLVVATFHSFCVRLLRRYHEEAGMGQDFTIADSDDSRKILRAVLKRREMLPDDAKRYHEAISWAKNNAQGPDSIESTLLHVRDVFVDYQAELSRQNMVDFDDLLTRTLALLRRDAQVREECQLRYQYLMVDEYQDTNLVQYEIVKIIAEEHHNLCVVGDHDQMIYVWRGAFREAVNKFLRDFPEAKVVTLDQNYRSTKSVVSLGRKIIEENESTQRGELWTDNELGESVRVVEVDDDRDEAAWVVGEISRNTGTSAIIVRTKAQTKAFEVALSAHGIAHVVVGTQRFYDRAEIKDALAWLRLALNGHDVGALTRAAGAPKRGLGDTTLAKWLEISRELDKAPVSLSEVDLEGLSARQRGTISKFCEDVAAVRLAGTRGPGPALEAVFAAGLRASLSGEPDRVENLSQLAGDAAVFLAPASDDEPDVVVEGLDATRAFVESASLSSNSDQSDSAQVAVITAHASKGREFDNVYVAGAEAGLYPHRLVVEEEHGVEEERRLLFVAVTRARSKLTLLWCRRRMVFGKWEDSSPSPFLDGLGEHVVEIRGSSSFERGQFQRRDVYAAPRSWVGAGARETPRASPGAVLATLSADQLTKGTRVSHLRFGEGTVVADADEREVKVRFADKSRTLLVAMAPLSLL